MIKLPTFPLDNFITGAILGGVLLATPAFALDLRQEDKQIHMAGSAIASAVVYKALDGVDEVPRKLISFAVPMILGFAKEISDDRFSWEDIAADTIGASLVFTF